MRSERSIDETNHPHLCGKPCHGLHAGVRRRRATTGVAAQTVQGGSITGTTDTAAASRSSTVPPPLRSRLDDIIARGTLRICTTGDYKPYSFLRPDG
jgi:hypothetical protein